MIRFPLSIDLAGKSVFLIGNGPQICEKMEKLAPFGANIIRRTDFTPEDAAQAPALVIVGDTEPEQAERIRLLCMQCHIPVNVVDVPQLCSFYFPALIVKGDLMISVSTGGRSPAAAAHLRQRIEMSLPDRTEEILDWLIRNRTLLRTHRATKQVTAAAFECGRPLTQAELAVLLDAAQA